MKFDRQIFISYAHLDDQPLMADQAGWVSLFHSTLQTLLSQRLGAPADIWRDDKLRGNDTFSDEILKQLAGTAIFVSILTPRYLKSEWCTKEIRSFCQQAEAGQSLVVDNKARVIKVLKLPIDAGQSLPPVVGQQLGYEFYEFDEDHPPRELDPAYGDKPRQAFLRKANKLAWDLAAQLDELQRSHPAANDAAAPAKPAVFLAECSRDRRDARERIEAELACCGYTVLPDQRLPDDEDEHLAAVDALLARCVLSIHLIGSGVGRVPDGDRQQSVVVLQNERAAAKSRSAGLRRVIWLPAGLASPQPAQQAFIDALQNDAALQFGADLVTGEIETAKAAIHAALKPPPVEGSRCTCSATPPNARPPCPSSSCCAATGWQSACRCSSVTPPRFARPTSSSRRIATPSCSTTALATKPGNTTSKTICSSSAAARASAPCAPASPCSRPPPATTRKSSRPSPNPT